MTLSYVYLDCGGLYRFDVPGGVMLPDAFRRMGRGKTPRSPNRRAVVKGGSSAKHGAQGEV